MSEPLGEKSAESAEAQPKPVVVWPELVAVLVLGVVSPLCSALAYVLWPEFTTMPPGRPFAFDVHWHVDRAAVVTAVMLFVLWRSGEPWACWGFVRFAWYRDLPLGIALWIAGWFVADMSVLAFATYFGGLTSEIVVGPETAFDYGLLVVFSCANGFAEEVVMRAYLLPRFEQMLRSTIGAVVLTSVLFASYHLYQGTASAAGILALGLVYGTFFVWLRRFWPLMIAHALVDFYAYYAAAAASP